MDEKKRLLVHYGPQSWEKHYQYNWPTDPSPGAITKGVSLPIWSKETTQSRGHGWPSANQASTDVGGDFTTIKLKKIDNHTPGIFTSVRSYGSRYIGPAWACNPWPEVDAAIALVKPSSDYQLMQLGTTAIARCIPTNPVADGATFLGELKAGVPKLIGKELLKTKFKDYRKYGSEYINYQFGWAPIVSDLQKFGTATIESEKILKQLERDSGKNIRRKYAFPDDVVTTSGKATGQYCWIPPGTALSTYLYDGSGTLSWTKTTTTKTWFSGCFTYHLNMGKSTMDKLARSAAEARKLYGLEITPEVVWNLAPWSWALDWEGTTGDVLHNVSRFAQDGLVMRYGYIMQQKTAVVDITLSRGGIKTAIDNSDLRFSLTAESKVRRRATPFGFGFDMNALTGRQSAILGALGISRGPRHL